jgi:hypothetical protein
VIKIDSILDIESGWGVNFSDQFKSKSLEDNIIVGIAGLANKGKTFLTNKLCDQNFEAGFHVKTEGLSMKYAQNSEKIVSVLDSAGCETPIQFFTNDGQYAGNKLLILNNVIDHLFLS